MDTRTAKYIETLHPNARDWAKAFLLAVSDSEKLGQTIALCDMAQVVALEARVKELESALEFIRDAKDDGESAEGPVVNVVFLQEQARSVLTPDNRRQDAEEDGA